MACDNNNPERDKASIIVFPGVNFLLSLSKDQNRSGANINAVASPIAALTKILEKRKGA